MSMSPFPHVELSAPTEGILSQEISTILKHDGKIVKRTVTRVFTKDYDYTDSMVSEVLYVLE